MGPVKSYKDLIVWQRSIELVKAVYLLTKAFPQSEMYGITSQIRRAAVSFPSNSAEGYGRRSRKEYRHSLTISYGSALELETQLYIAKELVLAPPKSFESSDHLLNEVLRMLNKMTSEKYE